MREICSSGLKRGRVIPPYSTHFSARVLQYLDPQSLINREGRLNKPHCGSRDCENRAEKCTKSSI